jgi:hypothetical protein
MPFDWCGKSEGVTRDRETIELRLFCFYLKQTAIRNANFKKGTWEVLIWQLPTEKWCALK